ncbi:related to dimeric dihydrodiol dehydrogenase [Phialocephala subalpina]|uniref:D-xylose 1-dehydrogenase (NADP(+), D-xylono-1,5-lactone-forming) n=1 Tax=Phialocephala subalpina TaxID=576137 RepID=A0A1L7XUL7_9HELO|nr:related to dimeric dihydrodiol dehydrogenase [Phialocephala subalpina]
MGSKELLSLRWGIVGCGLISSWFVADLVLPRAAAPTNHVIKALGSSSVLKGHNFAKTHCPSHHPSIYASYEEVYNDPEVDIVYIGTPHVFHLENALGAIKAGKHVLVEKPMTMNARDAEILIATAKEKGVFLMEALWTRFNPLVAHLQRLLHQERILGPLHRVSIDFSLHMPFSSLPTTSRAVDPSLGAGALLDIGIYTLTWAALILDSHPDHIAAGSPTPWMASTMSLNNGVDETTAILLNYKDIGCQAICTSTYGSPGKKEFCRIEGEKGEIVIGATIAASNPGWLEVKVSGREERIDVKRMEGAKGFYFEADAVAEDLRAGRLENDVCPLGESVRIIGLMDMVRKINGLRYPQDED